jgi:predicted nucleic acid-binding Zn ribbon protein
MTLADKRRKMRRPAVVSDLLTALLRGTPAEKRLQEGRIWLVWEDAVGSRIASHAVPSGFRDGTLTVSVDSAPWMQQLSYLKRELISKVNEELGYEQVKDLYFKAGKIAAAAEPEKPKPAQRRELSAEEQSLIAEQSAAATDPDLQAVFERLIRKDRETGSLPSGSTLH